MSIVKRFKLTENHAVTFREEGYNVFNHPTFGAPGTKPEHTKHLRKFQHADGARTMQMALRMTSN